MSKALIVVDVQNDFCPGGALAVPGGDEIVAGINTLMWDFDTVVLTQDWHPAGHSSFARAIPTSMPLAQHWAPPKISAQGNPLLRRSAWRTVRHF